jgi:hypothetical protein
LLKIKGILLKQREIDMSPCRLQGSVFLAVTKLLEPDALQNSSLEACLKSKMYVSWTKKSFDGYPPFSDPPTFPIKLALYPTISPLNHDFHWFCTTIIWWWVSQRIKEHIEKYSPIKILINAAIWHHYGKSQFLVREPSNWMVPIFPMLNCPCRAHDR